MYKRQTTPTVVLRVDPRLLHAWDDEEVAARWNRLTRSLEGPVDSDAATVREQSLLQQSERRRSAIGSVP